MWLNPQEICSDVDYCVVQLKQCLQLLADAGHVELDRCDTIIRQYKEMARAARASDEFIKFEIGTSRLNTLFHECLAGKNEMEDLWLVVQKLLLLSHGQASIERGFSVNKETLKENMS